MKLTFPSAFQKTKKCAPAESRDALPQYSFGFRAMALLTASIVFFQAPVSLIAATWNPFLEIENAQTLATKLSLIGGGSFSNTGVGSHWVGNPPAANETAEFRLFSGDYLVLIDRPSAVGGLLTTLGGGAAGSTVAIGSSSATASLTLGSTGIAVDAGNLRLDSGLSVIFGASQTWSPAVGTVLDVRSTLSGGSVNYSLAKQGPGQLILSGNNTFAGGVSLDGGVLVLNASGTSATNSAVGTGVLTINGGSLDNTSAGTVLLATNNTQAWNGDFTYIGSQGRVLNVGTGAVTLGDNRNVSVAAGEFAVGGIIGGTYGLTKGGTGALTLSGANTFDGGLTLSAGKINFNSHAAAGTGIFTIQGGSIDNTSASAVTLTAASQVWNSGFTFIGTRALNTGTGNITLSTGTVLTIQGGVFTLGGELGGNASVTKAGAGRLQLEAAAAYTGSTTVTAGTLSTNAANLLPDSTDVTIGAGATIELGGAQTIESLSGSGNLVKLGALTLSNGSGNSYSGILSGSGDVTLDSGTLTLAGANTYSGITTINSGATLKIANSAALGGTVDSTSISSGATLNLNGQTNIAESIDVRGTGNAGAGALINSASLGASVVGTVKLWANSSIGGSGDITLSGRITEDTQRNLTKVGVGTLTLDGPSTLTGTTTVAEGVLKLANNNALGNGTSNSSGVSVTSGASLDLNGTEPVSVPLTLNGAGVSGLGALANSAVAPATYAGDVTLGGATSIGSGIKLTGSIIGAQALTKVGAGLLVFEGAANAAASVAVTAGTVQVGNGSTIGTLGAANVSVADGAVLAFKRSDDYTAAVTNLISGSGNVTVASGTLTLSGTNTYTGITSLLNGSSLILGSADALGASSEARVAAGALLDLGGNASSVNLFLNGQSDSVPALTNSGALVTYGGLVSLANGTVTAIGGSGDIILSRAVSGGTLSKVGANTLTLRSLNNFGKTSVSSGALKLADAGSFGTEDVQVNTGAQIIFARTDASLVNSAISGAGAVSVEAGTLTLIGLNTYTGATTVTAATLSIGNGGANGSITSDIAFDTTSSLKFNLSSDPTYGGVLSGDGAFTKLGTGTLSLSGNSDLRNATIVVDQGRLSIGAGGATGQLQGDISVANNAALQFNRTGSLTYSQVISGSGSVSNIASGTITLEGTQTYFGTTNVSSGTLLAETLLNTSAVNVSVNGALTIGSFSASAPLNISGNGVVTVTGTGLSVGQINNTSVATTGLSFTEASDTITVVGLSGSGATSFASNATIGGAISAGSVTVAGLLAATDVSGGALTTQTLTATGTISGGAIAASGDATIGRVSAGSLTLGGATNTVTELLGGTFNFTNATAAFTVAGGIQDAKGVISGSANLTSAGNLTLNGENTYTRGTALTGGTLTVGGTSALGSGELVVTSGASLDASTAGARIANQISLGGELNFRGSNSLTAQGSLILSAPSSLNVAAQSLTLSGSISTGASALTKEGVGTLALTGTESDVALIINAGVVTAGTSALSTSATVTTASLGTFSLLGNQSIDTINGSGNLSLGSSSLTLGNGGTFSGVISGNQESFLNLSAGNLTISGNSPAFEGTLGVNGGIVDLNQTTQRVGSAILNGGTIQNGTLDFRRLTLSSGSYNATLSGQGELRKDSTAQTVSLGADNSTFTGIAVIQGGTLALENTSALTSAVRVIFEPNVGSATLRVGTSNVTISSIDSFGSNGAQGIVAMGTNTLTLQSPGGSYRFDGSITSAAGGSLVLAGFGKQVLAGDSTGATFRTVVQSGVLEIRHELALGDAVNEVALSGGTLSINTLGVLAARHNLTSTGASSLVLGGERNQVLGTLSIENSLAVDAAPGATSSSIQGITFGATTLGAASTVNVGRYASVSLGDIGGNHDFIKSGDGALTLTGANTSTGATTVNGGSLLVASSGVLASGNLTVDGAGAVLDLGSTSQTVGAVSVINGAVQQGTLEGATFSLNNATISAQLIGNGALTSSGATTLSGQNTYSGGTTVNGGSLTVAATGSLNATGSLAVSQAAYANFLGTNVTIGSISGAGTTSFSGTANITAALTEGVVNIKGDANLTGGVTGGTVTVDGAANSALSGGSLTLNGSENALTTMTGGSLTLAANKIATVATFTNGDASVAGTLRVSAGTFVGTLRGAGSLDVLNGNNVTLNGSLSTFEGAYTVDASTLSIGSATSNQASLALISGGTANLNFDGGSLRAVANDGRLALTNGTISLGALTGIGVVSSSGSTILKVGASTGSAATFGGSLTGGIALTKQGNDLITFRGNSDHTGATTITGGVLVAESSQALSTGSIAVTGRGVLGVSGGITLSNSIRLDGTSGASPRAQITNYQGQNVLLSDLNVVGQTRVSVTSGSLLTSSITATPGTQTSLDVLGNSGISSLTVGGNVDLGNDGILEARFINLTLLQPVTAREVRISDGSASLRADINADLALSFGASATLGNSLAISSLASDLGTSLNLASNSLTILDGRDLVAGGAISGSGSVTLRSGSLTLSGANTYTGGTTLTDGFLNVTGNLALGGNLTINAGTAEFSNASVLGAVVNSGLLRFDSAVTMSSLTGDGRTLFAGGVSLGDVTGGTLTIATTNTGAINNVGALSNVTLSVAQQTTVTAASFAGTTATVDGILNITGGINGGQVTNNGVVSVGNLTGGSFITAQGSVLNVTTGAFGGTISGVGSVNTTGAFNIAPTANLGASLRYSVAPQGALTFQGVANIGTLENNGSTTFSNGGSLSTQTGVGRVNVSASTLTVERGLNGRLTVGSLASAVYTQSANLSDVDNRGSLTLPSGSTVTTINSVGTLTHSGNLTINGSGAISALSGGTSTSLTMTGQGMLTLGGAYLGSTVVNQGTLSLNAGALLSGAVEVNGGRLILGGTDQLVGNLTLSGGVVDLNGYAQLMVGAFTSTGGTLGVSGGTLAANSLNISGGTQNAVTLLRGDGVQTFNGTVKLSQIGTIEKKNAVALNGTGASVTTGSIFASSITLRGSSNNLVVSGGSVGSVPVTNTIIVGGSSNTLKFERGFAPQGPLELIVGDATSTGGSLDVGVGGLILGGSQILKGKGTIVGNVTLRQGSTFAPGNSPGVIQVAGTLIASGATLEIEYDRTAAVKQDQVEVTAGGNVTVTGGTLKLNLGTGASRFRVGQDTFLPVFTTSGGTAGTAVVNGGTGFDTIIAPAAFGVTFAGGTISFASNGFSRVNGVTGNVSSTGGLVDRAIKDGSDTGSLRLLIDNGNALGSTNAATVAATLAALDPGVYADLGNVGLDRLRDVQAGLANHIDMLALDTVGESTLSLAVKPGQSTAAAAIEQSRAWTTAYGGWGKRSADSVIGSAGYSSNHFGDISGVETKVGGLTLGVLGAVGSSSATFENGRGKLTSDSWHAGFYGNLPAGAFVLDASFAYGQSEGNLKRSVNVAGGGATTGKTQGTEWTGQVGVAVPFRTEAGSLVITPSVHLIHANVKQDGLTESSLNGLEAVVKDSTTKSTAVRTGVQAAKITKLANKTTRLTASLDWVHSFDSGTSDVEIALQGAGTTTSRFQGSRSSKDAIRIGLGAEIALTERTRFRLNVDEQIRSGMQSTFGSASLGFQF